MSKFVMPITTAVLLFPLIAALITAPFLIYKYRKVGSVPWLHAAAMYSFVFYLMCAYFLVLLPLPADRTAVVAYAQTPQLIPFQFVRSFLAETTARLDDPSTWLAAICDPYMYEAFFNVLLLVPLGAYLRYYFHRPWWQTLLIGFCVTLSFETTQLTGIWGIYEHPYRLFDVDDLMTNTLGCMVGFWLAGPVMRVLPDVRVAARQAAERGTTASATRRALTFGLDLALSQALAGCGYFAVHAVNGSRLLAGFGIEHATFWTCECAAIAAVFALFPVIARGQTPAQKLLRLRIIAIIKRRNALSRFCTARTAHRTCAKQHGGHGEQRDPFPFFHVPFLSYLFSKLLFLCFLSFLFQFFYFKFSPIFAETNDYFSARTCTSICGNGI